MENYKPNSHKSKEDAKASNERQKLEKVVKGNVITKKNEMRKLKDVFISEDVKSVKSYILLDVLVPAIKDAIEDIVTNGIRIVLRGETGARKTGSNASRVSYSRYYDRRDEDRFARENRASVRYSYYDITLESRGEAEDVISRMEEIIETYGFVRVADLYDLVGITGDYTDNNYGWTNISSAEPVRVRNGYMLRLPRAIPLNR